MKLNDDKTLFNVFILIKSDPLCDMSYVTYKFPRTCIWVAYAYA